MALSKDLSTDLSDLEIECAQVTASGAIYVPSSGLFINGTAVTASAATLNALAATTATGTELDKLAGVVAGTVSASKGVVVGSNKNIDTIAIAVSGLKIGAGAGTAVDTTAAELNTLAGVTAGTAAASKAVVLTTGNVIDTIDITSPKINGTAVGSSAAEIDARCDDSAMEETVTTAGAVSVTKAVTKIDSTLGGMAVTLAAPSKPGMIKVIKMTVDGGDTTLALTNVVGQSSGTTCTFGDNGDTLVLVSDSATSGKWIVLAEVGTAMS